MSILLLNLSFWTTIFTFMKKIRGSENGFPNEGNSKKSIKQKFKPEIGLQVLQIKTDFTFEICTRHVWRKSTNFGFLKSTQYKKHVPNILRFTNKYLKACKPHEKKQNKKLKVWCSPCDLQDFKFYYVNRKAFGPSFLYWFDFKETR